MSSENKNAYPIIELTAETPFERGVQYGTQAADRIHICVEYYKKSFEKQGFTWEKAQEYAMGYLPIVKEEMPEILEEAEGVAKGSGHSLGEIMAVNCRYEVSKMPKPEECTTAAILPEASKGGKTYAVKNWDFHQAIMPHIVLLRIRTKEYSAIGWAEAGQMPREGFNSYGVAIINNGLASKYDYYGEGLPVTFLRRRVLASKSFEEAADLVKNLKRCISNNVVLVGKKGQVLDFEVQPHKKDQVYSQGGILTHANHFVVDPDADAYPKRAKVRDVRLMELLSEKRGEIDVPFIMECMKDHKYWPKAICSHPTFEGDERTYIPDGITVASMIVDFEENTAYISSGPPCENEYIAYKL